MLIGLALAIFAAAALVYIAPQYWVLIVGVVALAGQAVIGGIGHQYGAVWFGGRPAMQHVRNSAIGFVILLGLVSYSLISKYNQGQTLEYQVSLLMAIGAALAAIAIAVAFLRSPSR